MYTLILSPRFTLDSDKLWKAATQLGWPVQRAHRTTWQLEEVPENPVLYGEPLFNEYVAQQLNLKVVEPPEDFLVKLPYHYVKRKIQYKTVEQCRTINKPTFIKPPNFKCFAAAVYATGMDLPEILDPSQMVLTSDVVNFTYEARFFILDRVVQTWSPYLIDGKLNQSRNKNVCANRATKQLVVSLLNNENIALPAAVVLDCGWTNNGEAAIIEANEVCGSGIYGCSALRVLNALKKGCIAT